MTIEPLALAPGEGLSVENPIGGSLTFKVTGANSRGTLTAIETVVPPGEGPPLHVHHDEDELIYTLEGNFRVKLAEIIVDAPSGSCVFIPRGTPHTWQNVGDTTGRFFATVMPAAIGFEQFFMRYSALPSHERGADSFERLGIELQALEVLGPPMAQSDPL